MSDLRLTLLIIGVLIIVGVWGFELFKRRRLRRAQPRPDVTDDLFAEPLDTRLTGLDSDAFDLALDEIPDMGRGHDAVAGQPRAASTLTPDRPASTAATAATPAAGTSSATVPRQAPPQQEPAPERGVGAVPAERAAHEDKAQGKPQRPASRPPAAPARRAAPSRAQEDEDELIVAFTVMARRGDEFAGTALHEAFDRAGLRYGEMQIYHYYGHYDGAGEGSTAVPVFSVANVLKPGTFDAERFEDFATPGLSLFMRLPGELDGRDAFELLLSVGNKLATDLGGVLCDQSRNVLTSQTINHLRERIAEFGRRQMLRAH